MLIFMLSRSRNLSITSIHAYYVGRMEGILPEASACRKYATQPSHKPKFHSSIHALCALCPFLAIRIIGWKCWKRIYLYEETMFQRARGVVVSHRLRMRKALGLIPGGSILCEPKKA